MRRDLRDAYERELNLLREKTSGFARDEPGMTERLGGFDETNMDPSVAALLEGTAFMAARVQVEINRQFGVFSRELLARVHSDALRPLASCAMVRATRAGDPADLALGVTLAAGTAMVARRVGDGSVTFVPFRLCEPVTLWPLSIERARLHSDTALLGTLGFDLPTHMNEMRGVLEIELERTDGGALGALPCDTLPICFSGPRDMAMQLFEQVFARLDSVWITWEDTQGVAQRRQVPNCDLRRVTGGDDGALHGSGNAAQPGFVALLEHSTLPDRFLGLRLCNFAHHLRGIAGERVTILLGITDPDPVLTHRLDATHLSLFCGAAINHFEQPMRPIDMRPRDHDRVVHPSNGIDANVEIVDIVSVSAQVGAARRTEPVLPLYSANTGTRGARATLYYTTSRVERDGSDAQYRGTDTRITLYQPPEDIGPGAVSQIFIRALCSSRNLAADLPRTGVQFEMVEDRTITFDTVTAPTRPRGPIADSDAHASVPHGLRVGPNDWRLLSHLTLAYRGLAGWDGQGDLSALHDLLRLFAQVSDPAALQRIEAITGFVVTPCTRTLRRPEGFLPARGLLIELTFDEMRLAPARMVLLSSALDAYFADHASVSAFTQLQVCDSQGRRLVRWPARSGSGPLL